ncbi:hypothetical protein NDU88_005806 [Pleurodeles waltl]|uniref:Uncharacterized protein n=1 Tax=Pleurodeles waltl TaxID=8319 RepID=A0AAV7RL83_PLEWA|nr:hypothetical protein NDU88_005806 [Pleurodeles waltl]
MSRCTEERRKGAGAGHWSRAALELSCTGRGAARIALRGNSSSGSTSESAWERKEEPRAPRQSVKGAATGAEVGTAGGAVIRFAPGQAKTQSKLVMEVSGLQSKDPFCDASGTVEKSALSSSQANGYYEGQAMCETFPLAQNSRKEPTSPQAVISVLEVSRIPESPTLSEVAALIAPTTPCLTQGSSIEAVILSISEDLKKVLRIWK